MKFSVSLLKDKDSTSALNAANGSMIAKESVAHSVSDNYFSCKALTRSQLTPKHDADEAVIVCSNLDWEQLSESVGS